MRKTALVFSIFVLILITSVVKNSTKEIEDKIFTIKENVTSLETEFGNAMLEFNYLSSPERLTQHKFQYFQNELKEIKENPPSRSAKLRYVIKKEDFYDFETDILEKFDYLIKIENFSKKL